MIALRSVPAREPVAVPAPRIYGLAKLAAARIAAGHDPIEAILAALATAADAPGLPNGYDGLTALERQFVLVLWGNHETRLDAIRAATGRPTDTLKHLAKRLMRRGLVCRVRIGVYRLNPTPPPVPVSPPRFPRAPLLAALEGSPRRLCELARNFGIGLETMRMRLLTLSREGKVVRIDRGVYARAVA